MSETSQLTIIIDSEGNRKTLEVSSEQPLLQALQQQNLYIKSSCGGVASCGDCIIKVLSSGDNLSPPGFDEINLLGNVFHLTKERLSCQTKALGNATIDISHHDKNRDQENIKNRTSRMPPPSRHKVRKQKEVEALKQERLEKKREKNRSWERHWEKKSSDDQPPPKQGGYRRPRPFRTDHLDEDEEKS